MDKDKNTQPQEETKPEEQETKPEQKEEGELTVGEQLEPKPKKPDSVPFEVFEGQKKELKEVKENLQKLIDEQKTNQPVDEGELGSLAKKFNVDVNFLNELASTIDRRNKKEYGERIESYEKEVQQTKREKVFENGFTKAMQILPDEYKDVVNPEVIKQLSFNPANSNKTLSQIIKDTYGGTFQGRKTLENSTPNTRTDDSEIDFDRAAKDSEYFKTIKADPAKRKKYNEGIEKRINF